MNTATGRVLAATATVCTGVPPVMKSGSRLFKVLVRVMRSAFGACPLAGSNTYMPLASAREVSQTLHSTVTSPALKVSRILGTLASTAAWPAAWARLQSAGAPRPSTCTADSAARSDAFCISRFM